MNKVILMGRLTRDPEIRYPSGGADAMPVCRYSMAVNRSYKREGEPDADFLNIVAFGKRAEFANKYFKKGQMVAVVGELRTGSYTDREGIKRYTTDVIVNEQHFTGSKSEGAGRAPSAWDNPDFAPPEDNRRTGTKPAQQYQGAAPDPGRQVALEPDAFIPLEGEEDLPF